MASPAQADAQAAARRVHGPPAEEAVTVEVGYAGLVTRTVAFAIDAAVINLVAVVVGVVVALVFSVIPESHDVRTAVVALGGAAFLIWTAAYFVTFWSTTGVIGFALSTKACVNRIVATAEAPAPIITAAST